MGAMKAEPSGVREPSLVEVRRSDVLLEIGRMIGIRTGKERSCSRARGKRSMGRLRQRKKCSLVGGWSKRESAKKEVGEVPTDQVMIDL